jgi:hypothetical protein
MRVLNPSGTSVGDAGGSAGSSKNGQNYLTEIGITNTGTPLCVNDALTNAVGGYHQLCLGANSLGGGLVSYNAYGGAAALPLSFEANGTTFILGQITPCIGCGTMAAQNANDVAITGGTLSGITNITQTPTIVVTPGNLPSNSALWIDAIRSGTAGSGGSALGGNPLALLQQTETVTDTEASHTIDTLYINHLFGTGEGSRAGIFVNLQNTAATANPTSPNAFYTGVFSNVEITHSDDAGGAKGDFSAFASQTDFLTGTHNHGGTGAELDISLPAGATLREKSLLELILFNTDAVQGTNVDEAIGIHRQIGVAGTWQVGIEFGKPGYTTSFPFNPSSTIMLAGGEGDMGDTVLSGIDFSRVSFVGCAFQSKGFCVADSIGIILNSPRPTISLQDNSISNPAVHGGLQRIAAAGSSPDEYLWQVNTAVAGDFSTHIDVFHINSSGTFVVDSQSLLSNGTTIGSLTPTTPPLNFYTVYVDTSDNKLKAIASTGTVTILAVP